MYVTFCFFAYFAVSQCFVSILCKNVFFLFWVFLFRFWLFSTKFHKHFCGMNKNITKFFTLVTVLISSVTLKAQAPDSVVSGGGVYDVYYDFETQKQDSVARSSWDIGLSTSARSSSIIINENAGVSLYKYSDDTTDWRTLDTTGFAFENLYNSENSWDFGAFSNLGTNHPDYGWGIYNMNTHDINGSRLFIVKLQSGKYIKMVVDQMTVVGDFVFRTANLDGSDAKTTTINKSKGAGMNFILVNLSDTKEVAKNPMAKDWDLLFTKYMTEVAQGPTTRTMAVSGVKVNAGCQVAKRSGVNVTSDDTSSLDWKSNITEIGYDWKSFNRSTFQYDITADLTYFIRTKNGAVWKIWFTGYTGSSAGKYVFNTKEIKAGVNSIPKFTSLNTKVFPNPATTYFTIQNNEPNTAFFAVSNLTGEQLLSGNILPLTSSSFDLSMLSSGIYTIQLITENGTDFKKLIVE